MEGTVKIMQLVITPNDSNWQGILVGLGDNGITYEAKNDGHGWFWDPIIPNVKFDNQNTSSDGDEL